MNYRDLPRSVADLTFEFTPSNEELDTLPEQLTSLTITGAGNRDGILRVPRGLRSLKLDYSDLASVVEIPATLIDLHAEACDRLAHIEPLPSKMTMVNLTSCQLITGLGFLPTDVESLVLSDLPLLETLDDLPERIERLTLDVLPSLISFAGIGPDVKTIVISSSDMGAALSTLRGPIQSLTLTETLFGDDPLFAEVDVETMTLIGSDLPLDELPRSLKELTITGTSHETLFGLPQDLESLSLEEMESLESYSGLPPCIQHMRVKDIYATDFPRLCYLDSFELDEITTVDGVIYTSAEAYMADSKCRAKRPSMADRFD